MAHSFKLFDFTNDTEKERGTEFLTKFDKNITALFGPVYPEDKQRKYYRWKEVPEYVIKGVQPKVEEILGEKLDNVTWDGSFGIYGRKMGTTIKKKENVDYRVIINLGGTELYWLDVVSNEPAVLLNGYGLLISPIIVASSNTIVNSNPIRKNLKDELKKIVPQIRGRKYLRSTIVLDITK